MKVTYTSKSGQMQFEFDAADQKQLFAQRAIVELHDEECCGKCKCPSIRCEVRKAGDFIYYEMRCQNRACNARLDFGQNKDEMNLFAKRDAHPESNGWYIYEGNDQGQEESPRNGKQTAAGSSGPKTPIPTRTQQAAAPIAPPPADDTHARALAALRVADTQDNADSWLAWGATNPGRTPAQKRDQEAAHKSAVERIRNAKAKSMAG
jgi:hypothetical protein